MVAKEEALLRYQAKAQTPRDGKQGHMVPLDMVLHFLTCVPAITPLRGAALMPCHSLKPVRASVQRVPRGLRHSDRRGGHPVSRRNLTVPLLVPALLPTSLPPPQAVFPKFCP